MTTEKKTHTVLIVAGDYDIVEPVQSALKDKRLSVHVAVNHRQATYLIKEVRFELMLVDAAMKDRYSGSSTITTLSEANGGIPMIALALDGRAASEVDLPAQKVLTNLEKRVVHFNTTTLLGLGESSDKDATQRLTAVNASLEQRIEEIQTLFALSKSLTEVLDLSEVLNRVVEAARRLTDAEEGMILMPDEEGDLYLRAKVGIDVEDARNFRIRTNDSIAGEVFKSGYPTLIGAKGQLKVKTEYFVNSLLYVPIVHQGKPIGVLGVNNKTKRDLFDQNDQELLMNLGSYAAIAIENARIHEESLKRASELSALVEASLVVNSSLTLDETLPNICHQLAKILDVNCSEIYEWDRENQVLRCLARYKRSVWSLKQGPKIVLAKMPAFKAAMENDTYLWVSRNDLSFSAEAELLEKAGASAMLLIPIATQGRLIGALQVFYIRPREEQQPAMIALQRARHFALEVLASILTQPGSTPSKNIFQILEGIKELLDADWYQLSVMNQQNDALVVTVEMGDGVWLDSPYPYIELMKYPDLIEMLNIQSEINIQADSAGITPGGEALLNVTAARSILGLPLIQRGEISGLVIFADTQRPHHFRDRDVDFGRAIVGQAATALENAHLVHDLEQSLSELRAAQERLVQTARLSAMGELAAVVAHQINNPLTTIMADAEMILTDEPRDSLNYEAMEAILRAGKRAASVARRLLSVSRPNEPDAPTEKIDVVDTIEGVLTLVKTHIERDGIQILDKLPQEKLPAVHAVRGRLDDVWLNLLLNAHDALQGIRGAKIGIEVVPHLEIGYIDVIVWDTGPGIPDHIKNEVFRPFFTTKPAGEGTGLGLHICRQTVQQVGGDIFLESQQGQGARFLVRLPVEPDA